MDFDPRSTPTPLLRHPHTLIPPLRPYLSYSQTLFMHHITFTIPYRQKPHQKPIQTSYRSVNCPPFGTFWSLAIKREVGRSGRRIFYELRVKILKDVFDQA